MLLRRGDVEEAIATWRRCQQLDPCDGRAWIAMAKHQAKMGAFAEAEATMQEGLRWEPGSAYLLQSYGQLQERRGRQDDAPGRVLGRRPLAGAGAAGGLEADDHHGWTAVRG